MYLFAYYFSVKPEDVQFTTNATSKKVKQFEPVQFNYSGHANRPVTLYQLFVNDVLISESSTGVFSEKIMNSGNLTYKCAATNTVGTTSSQEVYFIVKGKFDTELLKLRKVVMLCDQTIYHPGDHARNSPCAFPH